MISQHHHSGRFDATQERAPQESLNESIVERHERHERKSVGRMTAMDGPCNRPLMAGSVSTRRREEADFRRDDAADGSRFSGAPAGTRYRPGAAADIQSDMRSIGHACSG